MKLRAEQRVSIEVAETRALAALSATPMPASSVAHEVWPGHDMKAQGAGAAASRILKRLEQRGLARWTSSRHGGWGWIRT